MKRIGALAVILVCALGLGCSKREHAAHGAEKKTAESPPPTPDTTPVAVLRTPAGLVLGIEGTPAPVRTTPIQTVPPTVETTRVPSS